MSAIEAESVEEVAQIFAAIDIDNYTEEETAALVAAVQSAPTEVRKTFEQYVDIYKTGLDDYVPVGSKIPVGERRTLIAVTAGTVMTAAGSKMRRR